MARAVTHTAFLIGLSPEKKCVYSASLALDDYWDGTHLWDDKKKIKRARMECLRGFLFDGKGHLLQEFENIYDISQGVVVRGWTRHADGTFQEFPAKAPDARRPKRRRAAKLNR
jgi:hypothetical protein